jgi:hypothetical protein
MLDMSMPKPERSGSSPSVANHSLSLADRALSPTKRIVLGLLISISVVIPCFWHGHIQAGDLGSHTYNVWLAQLIQQGKAPGLYLAVQWQNILFDFLLFYLVKLTGFALGEKLAVSICVLIFFWGVFTFIRAATGRAPWFVSPLIAMISYSYVFHMGFMNFYLSLGLASFGLALLWNGKWRGMIGAALLIPLVILAHPLGALWLLGAGSYRFAWLWISGWTRFCLPVVVIGGFWGLRWYLRTHSRYEMDWADGPFYQWNGFDQLRLFGDAYIYITWAILLLGAVFIAIQVVQHHQGARNFWKDGRLPLELYLVSFWAVVFVPADLRPDPTGSWIGELSTRLTLICAIFAICFLASLRPKILHLVGFGACAIVFFFMLHRDTGFLDRMEKNAEAITAQLPFGTRVASTIFPPPDFRPQYEHLVDRACIGHCFLYSNYEPSTGKFRVRVRIEGSRLVASVVDEAEDLQFGNYDVEDGDLPMKQIYQCDGQDLTTLCIRDLRSGEKNGRLGYHP